MSRKVRHSHKPPRSKHTTTLIGSVLAALVALTAWAHQQGVITWQLPTVLASPVTTTDSRSPMGATRGASETNCPDQFLAGKAPILTNDKLRSKTRELCYMGFAVLNSGVTRTPLWAAEHLTADRIATAKTLPRKDSFHSDDNCVSILRSNAARSILSVARANTDRD